MKAKRVAVERLEPRRWSLRSRSASKGSTKDASSGDEGEVEKVALEEPVPVVLISFVISFRIL